MKKITLLFFIFLSLNIFAGDTSVFKSLGFSDSGKYYMFSQYGIDSKTLKPYVEIYTVDVEKNTYVSDGVFRDTFNKTPTLGDDGESALLNIFDKTEVVRKKVGINLLERGRPIFFRLIKEKDEEMKNLDVIDYATNNRYNAVISQDINNTSSSFYIDLKVYDSNNNIIISKQVGHPSFRRENVTDYNIVQAILVPQNKGIIFIIQKKEQISEFDINIRYMVEAVSFSN